MRQNCKGSIGRKNEVGHRWLYFDITGYFVDEIVQSSKFRVSFMPLCLVAFMPRCLVAFSITYD
jgi:hypothetical protein